MEPKKKMKKKKMAKKTTMKKQIKEGAWKAGTGW